MVRKIEPPKPTFSILPASKKPEKCTTEVITNEVVNTTKKFEISEIQILMCIIDCDNLIYLTCKIYTLHLVAKLLEGLLAHIKAVFLISTKLHKLEPPQTTDSYALRNIFIRSTLLSSALSAFVFSEALTHKQNRMKLRDAQRETDSQIIYKN